jgi:hypothetical protein
LRFHLNLAWVAIIKKTDNARWGGGKESSCTAGGNIN